VNFDRSDGISNLRCRGITSTDLLCFIIACEITTLSIGTQFGSHEITELPGKGAMGEVYWGRDLKLKREVAIKILPEKFSGDADRVSRFQREAEVLTFRIYPAFLLQLFWPVSKNDANPINLLCRCSGDFGVAHRGVIQDSGNNDGPFL
jgi:hypothetical protein